MKMFRKKTLKVILYITGIVVVIAFAVIMYMMNMPHRDIQSTTTDFSLSATDLVAEYLLDSKKSDQKYLDNEGDSKVLEISGTVADISKDFQNNIVLLLKSETDKAGVSCTFTPESNTKISSLKIGDEVIIKGVIRSGASYDEDLDLYENVNLEKCDLK